MPSAASLAERTRMAQGLATLASAYLFALAKGQWASASAILEVFQDASNSFRSDLVAAFAARVGQAAAEAALPRSLPRNGAYTRDTRVALLLALVAGFGLQASETEMPSNAAGAGLWFNERVAPLLNSRAATAVIVASLGSKPPQSAGAAASNWFTQNVLGVTPTTPEFQRNQITSSPQPSVTHRDLSQAAQGQTPQELPALLVTGTAPRQAPNWGSILFLGALGLGAVGSLYYVYRRRRRAR